MDIAKGFIEALGLSAKVRARQFRFRKLGSRLSVMDVKPEIHEWNSFASI